MEEIMQKNNDKRSLKIAVCAHCILNQNAKLEGLAGWPGMIDEVVDIIRKSKAGILQMPCPEMLYEGIGRFDKSVEQYRCAAFRTICESEVKKLMDQVENYLQWGYKVPVILAIDGSPSCGFNLTLSSPEWRGLVAGKSWDDPRPIKESGVFMEAIGNELKRRNLNIPILGIPEVPELGSIDSALASLEKWLAGV
jgi:predicted secreted protein